MKKSGIIIGVLVILAVLFVWGLIGSSEAAKIGTNCDIGIGEDGSVFCWKWHQNIIGDIGDAINQVMDK
jgi:hypothetical protein